MDLEIKKTVSVIIPCFRYAKYLEDCIYSIVGQTYKPHEIIIVNDGSDDNTSEVAKKLIEKYPEYNIKLVEKENGGLSSARNAGIKIASGELIQCIDADDKMTPGGIEEHVKLITDDHTISQAALMEFGERHTIAVPNPQSTLDRIMQSNTIFCNAMFPRKAWVDVGGFDESETMRLGYEDWEFWIRCLAFGYHLNTSDFIALRYRVHEGQMTQSASWPNRQKLYNYIYKKHKELYDDRQLLVADIILENNE